jgi:hypothetical protein
MTNCPLRQSKWPLRNADGLTFAEAKRLREEREALMKPAVEESVTATPETVKPETMLARLFKLVSSIGGGKRD